MADEYTGTERRTGKDRRLSSTRRYKQSGFLMRLIIADRRSGLDRRAGLDRRSDISHSYHKELIINISKKSVIKHWDPEKAKMTYLWEKGLRAIIFKSFKVGTDVVIEINLSGFKDEIILKGKILRSKRIFTKHGFAAEVDVQFLDVSEKDIQYINNIIWSGDIEK